MSNKIIIKAGIVIMICFMTISAFFIRLENFKNSKGRSIDEIVYFRMALQILSEGMSGYNTIPYGKELSESGRDLPKYFSRPLFKHPPVFTLLLAASMSLFGTNFMSAGYVPILLGVLLIPLCYLLGKIIHDWKLGLFSALLMYFDPINIISSQKVWMETTLAFFSLLAILFFIYGFKKSKSIFFIFSGITLGVLINVRYTGVFLIFSILIFAVIYRRYLFKNVGYLWNLILPFILLLPWLFWNINVYGLNLLEHREFRIFFRIVRKNIFMFTGVIFFITLFFYLPKFINKGIKKPDKEKDSKKIINIERSLKIKYLGYLIVPLFLGGFFIKSLDIAFFPETSWSMSFIKNKGSFFYVRRLIEFFPVYFFSFFPFLVFKKQDSDENAVIRFSVLLPMLFFMYWGSFQSRYILVTIPFLLVLAASFIFDLFEKINLMENFVPRLILRPVLIVLILYILLKVNNINEVISYPNDMCYF